MSNRKRIRTEIGQPLEGTSTGVPTEVLSDAASTGEGESIGEDIFPMGTSSMHAISDEAQRVLENTLSIAVPLSSDEYASLRQVYPSVTGQEEQPLPLESAALSVLSFNDKFLDKNYRGIYSRCSLIQRAMEKGIIIATELADAKEKETIQEVFNDSITLIRDLKGHLDTLRMNAVTRRLNPRSPYDVSVKPTLFASRLGDNDFNGVLEFSTKTRGLSGRFNRPRFHKQRENNSSNSSGQSQQPSAPSPAPRQNSFFNHYGRGRGRGRPGRPL